MSQKKIRPPISSTTIAAPAGVPKELTEVDEVLKLGRRRGAENYDLALRCLLDRFASSSYARKAGKVPEQLVLESVHSLINVLNDVFPRNASNRPLGVPEVALLFGAVLGTAAAPAYVHGEVTLDEVEGQIEILWVAMREWLVRSFLAVKHIESAGMAPDSKLVVPPGIH